MSFDIHASNTISYHYRCINCVEMFTFVFLYLLLTNKLYNDYLLIQSTICYLKIASTFPVLFAALQTCFHVTLNVSSSVNEWLVTCEGWEPELRMIGFERLDNLNLFNKIRIFLPEIIVFVTAVTTVIIAKLSLRRQCSEEDDIIPLHLTTGNENNVTTFRRSTDSGMTCASLLGIDLFNIESLPRFIVILALWIAAVAHPCLFTSIYFLVLILSLFIWALDISLNNSCFKHISHTISFYTAFNLSALYLYQLWPIQKHFPPEDLPARLIGMKAYLNSSCNPGEIWTGEKLLPEIPAEVWLYPISLFILYFSIAYLDSSGPFINLNWDNEREPTTDANMANYDTTSRLLCPSRWYKLYRKILPLLLRNFFTFSLMVMMAWAVIYHSWLSFVWLVMACGIWIYHDSRKAYMLLSPLIIAYSQLLLTFFCYITIRLLMKEKKMKNFGVDSSSVQGDGNDNVTTKKNMRIHITRLLPKYWIYVVCFVLLMISIRRPVFVYNILYMAFFLVFISFVTMSFQYWKKMLFSYWVLLTAYSVFVLMIVYTFQFHNVPEIWYRWTNWPNETYYTRNLFITIFQDFGLVTYTSGNLFLHLSRPISFLVVVILQMKFFHDTFLNVIINPNVTCMSATDDSDQQPKRVWYDRCCLRLKIFVEHIWRILEVHFNKIIPLFIMYLAIDEDDAMSNQTILENLFQWTGFEKTDNIAFYLVTIIYQRQQYTRAVSKVSEPEDGIIFENCTRNDADKGLISCLKFLANYGCYKFGVELTYILITVSIAIRMDAFSLFYGLILLFSLMLQRRALANVWYMVCACFGVSILLQYGICVGLPPNLCLNYPWNFDLKLIQWLYLPDFKHRPHVSFLIADVAVFFFSICQLYAFRIERKRAVKLLVSKRPNHPVIDDNEPANWSFVTPSLDGPENELDGQRIPDFITRCSSALDVVKIVIFQYFHWLTLLAVLAAGVGGISAFTFGYLMAAFCFLWKGNDIFLTNPKGYLKQYMESFSVFQRFDNFDESSVAVVLFVEEGLSPDCKVVPDQAQIFYDTVCFAFLIFQLRILNSWYFKHVVVEFKAEQVFSARGAVLIGQLIWKTMTKQQERESEVVEKVKRKTELIRANYLSHLKENEYYDPKTYNEAKRAGDYYMFEYDSALDMIDAQQTPMQQTPHESDDDGVGPLQMIHMAVTSDLPLGRIADKVEGKGSLKTKLPDQKEEKPNVEKKPVERSLAGTVRYVKTLLVATLNRMIAYLNYLSYDYRYVAYVLRDEKVKLKSSLSDELSMMFDPDKLQQLINKTEIGQKIYRIPSERWLDKMQEKVENLWEGHGCLRRLFIALYYVIISHTDIVCYLMIILNQMFNASIISLPLPIFAFLWGVEKKADFAILDVILLMSLGLWRESMDDAINFDDVDKHNKEEPTPAVILPVVEPGNNGSYEMKEISRKVESGDEQQQATIQQQPCENPVINPPFRYITDVYAWMFLCDFICFLISAFSYTSFGVDTGRGDVVADIQSNKVPLPYVIILITLMVLMIIDRAIYLHKNVLKKLIFQYFLVFGTHIWIFFVLPAITGRYRIVPFLFELRSLIDWTWTQTSMSLMDYITMENIFAHLYTIRCSREMEKDYVQRKGDPKTAFNKYCTGLPILALYTSEAQGPFIRQLIPSEFDSLYLNYSSKHASTFLREYSPIDTVHTIFRVDSDTTWTISNPAKQALIDQVKSSAELTLTIFFKYIRPAQSSSEPNAEHSFIRQMQLAANSDTRLALAEALTAGSSAAVIVEKAFPSLVVVPALGNVHPAFSLVDLSASDSSAAYSDIYLRLHEVQQQPNNSTTTHWWQVTMTHPPIMWNHYELSKQDMEAEQADYLTVNDTVVGSSEPAAEPITWSGINMIAFVDRVFPSALSYFTSRGIIGVYIVVVFAVARYVRTATITPSMELTISEIPNVDRMLRLCKDVFLAREAKDFALEVDLFAKLLFLFRSPETLIRWTRHKVE
ncbi:Piezo-type mechanosensitive ion channel component 2 [Trichinella spiralis]|uniref:Piezo-type mechanosensitive ion channel component 2 n=1 Tax=Trichinella spiralis TaxID=6334 RepID=A0A0V1BNQ7_TRISP|nr:Piezo-type mechanosensitive ion channel component 2 [Trichinella spiralis]